MIKIFHPFRTQADCYDLIAAIALNDPRGDAPGIAVNGKCGSWLLIQGFPPFDGRRARAERQPKGVAVEISNAPCVRLTPTIVLWKKS
jgi:hypothetical protein